MAGQGRATQGARWRAWASWGLSSSNGIAALTPSNPLSSWIQCFTLKLVMIIWTMMY